MAHDVTWSADGHELIYANGHDLYSAKTDGSQPRKLLTASGFPFGTRFSPDGRSIRFTVRDATNDISLWEATTDGTGLHQVFPGWTNPPTVGNGQWTADGAYYISPMAIAAVSISGRCQRAGTGFASLHPLPLSSLRALLISTGHCPPEMASGCL